MAMDSEKLPFTTNYSKISLSDNKTLIGTRTSKELKSNLVNYTGRYNLYVEPDPEHPGFIKRAYWAESPSMLGDLLNATAEELLCSGEERNVFGETYILNQLDGSYFHYFHHQ